MSKRRVKGERVYKTPGAGFVGEGGYVTILGGAEECMLGCGDRDCTEWADTVSDEGGMSYHVSECEMLDAAPA